MVSHQQHVENKFSLCEEKGHLYFSHEHGNDFDTHSAQCLLSAHREPVFWKPHGFAQKRALVPESLFPLGGPCSEVRSPLYCAGSALPRVTLLWAHRADHTTENES